MSADIPSDRLPPHLGDLPEDYREHEVPSAMDHHLGEAAAEPEVFEEATAPRPSRSQRVVTFLRRLFQLRIDQSATRVGLVGAAFLGLFALISGRLVYLAVRPAEPENIRRFASAASVAARPDIIDRNGEVLATDVRMVSIFAEPRNIIDKDEAVELITAVLPDVNASELRAKLN